MNRGARRADRREVGGRPRTVAAATVALLTVVMVAAASCTPEDVCTAAGNCQPSDITPGRPNGPLVPLQGAYLGAFSSSGTWKGEDDFYGYYKTREAAAGRKFDIDNHFYSWTNPIPTDLERWDLANGRIPLITWQPTPGLTPINNGSQDTMISTTASAIKALGRPVFLRFGHEMNGNWYAWDGTHNNDPGTTNGPSKYIQAWRHVHDLFVRAGATNVVWVWEPNNESVPNDPWNSWKSYYPGASYVDWVGIDGYNWSTTREWGVWKSFETLVTPIYNDYHATKPIMISETSSVEQGGNKAQWISDTLAAAKSKFPSIAAVLWFDELKENDWRFDTSPAAKSAFAQIGADTYFRASSGSSSTNTTSASVTTDLKESTAADLSGAVPLQSTSLSGARYIRAETSGAAVAKVSFYLDDPTMSLAPRQVETFGPFDLAGGDAFSTSSLRPGVHTLTAVAQATNGVTVVTRATFTTTGT
jgi:hypothetical protein